MCAWVRYSVAVYIGLLLAGAFGPLWPTASAGLDAEGRYWDTFTVHPVPVHACPVSIHETLAEGNPAQRAARGDARRADSLVR